MDLEEMKNQWHQMSNELAEQKLVNKQLIMDMTKERFRNKISTISKFEGLGSLVCIPFALFILYNIRLMDSPLLIVAALFCVSTLIIVPIISMRLIGQMKESAIPTNNYSQSLINFAKSRKRFLFLQKSAGFWGILLMIAITPVFNRITGDTVFEYSPYFWIGMAIFVVLFSRWGYKRYERMTASAEELLRELGE